jgi:phosphoribosylamine--glycine ligase / phosphoribosylformylglycinamidine cyclo-ligase
MIANIPCFAPSQETAQLEDSKAFSKDFMTRHNIPTAEYRNFTDFKSASQYVKSISHKVVLKASGLAAGKGVIIQKQRKKH